MIEDSTDRVWFPTSVASAAQVTNRAVMASSDAGVRRSAPVADVSAMAIAIDVSSVHSPGSHPKPPPPTIATGSPWMRAGWNS